MTALRFELQDKQLLAFDSPATEILYGGAAYGGKSHLLRIIAVAYGYAIPGIQIYLFRRLSDDLEKNHIYGPSGFLALLAEQLEDGSITYNSQKKEITWKDTGSKIFLCHCQYEKDVTKYQGPEIHLLLMDELTHFTDFQYRFLRNRVRLGGFQLPAKYVGQFPRIYCASNPGSIGHAWVKRTFINHAAPYEIKEASDDEGGMMRQYIPARMEDNPIGMKNDPKYAKRLDGLGNPALVRAMKEGDWDIVAGAAFEKLSRDVHMIRPFEIPRHWAKFTSLDWGTAKPYSIGWYCVPDEDLILKAREGWPERLIPKGSIIRYRELYGFGGQADVGTREETVEVARKMMAMEKETVDYRIADSAMWAQHDGPSAAENFMNELVKVQRNAMKDGSLVIGAGEKTSPCSLEKSRKDRASNYLEIRRRIAAAHDGLPALYVTSNCEHFWRTVPELQLDQREPEKGWDTDQEDHVADELAYAVVSRPKLFTAKERDDAAYNRAKRQADEADRSVKKSGGRY